MTDKENELLKEKIRFLEQELEIREKKEVSLDEYLREMKIYSDMPRDQFAHQYKLLYHPAQEVTEKSKRADLFNPDVLLGNIKDSKTLYFLQRDFSILHRIYDMGLRSAGVMDLFNNLYYSWVGQIKLTGALGGNERWLQSFLEPIQPGFESFSFSKKEREQKDKKKTLQDYLKPIRDRRNIYD